ncbi:MAG: dihydropteroate synthase [Planctomycetota bacterium]|nr:dihydropteroate synthase [Planctomycetota bacterium]
MTAPAPINRPAHWRVGPDRTLPLDRAIVMAILNVTPDSFSDGGQFNSVDDVVEAARRAARDGADMLDIGGESTRPGAQRIAIEEQIRRVVPSIRAIREAGLDLPISVDTTRATVAQAALEAGADCINDVAAAQEDEDILALAARARAGLILMHRLRPPDADVYSHAHKQPPAYAEGVVESVRRFLIDRRDAALAAGIPPESIALDPGLGFGKSVAQNEELIAATPAFAALGHPLLSAASRKSFIGAATAVESPSHRLHGSIAVSVAQRILGANIFRVHDVREQVQALRMADRIVGNRPAMGGWPQ